jgi:hypothetical protein
VVYNLIIILRSSLILSLLAGLLTIASPAAASDQQPSLYSERLAAVSNFSGYQARVVRNKQVSTRIKTCGIGKTGSILFRIKFVGHRSGRLFKTSSIVYKLPSDYGNKSNINIFDESDYPKTKTIWKSPDRMKATGRWERHPVRLNLPLRQYIRVEAIFDSFAPGSSATRAVAWESKFKKK